MCARGATSDICVSSVSAATLPWECNGTRSSSILRRREAARSSKDGSAATIDRLTDEARNDEVFSTPTFIFSGGFRLVGAQEYAVFASVTQRLIERRSAANPRPL